MNEFIKVILDADASKFQKGFASAQASVSAFQKTMEIAKSSIQKVDETVAKVGRTAAGIGVTFAGAVAAAASAAASFDAEMRNVNSILYLTEGRFGDLSSAVVDLSRHIPKSANDLASGLYDIASSGFEAEEGLMVLEASGRAAAAGLTDTKVAAKAIAGALNAYGLDASEATDISDILFKTVESGVVSFEELAVNMADYTSVAAASGLALDEVSAALAALTLGGMEAAQASTSLSSIMNELLQPTEALAHQVNVLGYESALSMVHTVGLRETMLQLSDSVDGNVTLMGEMFNNIRAQRGIFSLVADDGALFSKTLDDIAIDANRAGSAARALGEQSKSFGVSWTLFVNELTASRIEIGRYYLPMLISLLGIMTSFIGVIVDAPAPFKIFIAVAAGLTAVFGGLIGMLAVAKIRSLIFAQTFGKMISNMTGGRIKTKTFSSAIIQMADQLDKGSLVINKSSGVLGWFGKSLTKSNPLIQKMGVGVGRLGARLASVTALGTRFSRVANDIGVRMLRTSASTLQTGNATTILASRMSTLGVAIRFSAVGLRAFGRVVGFVKSVALKLLPVAWLMIDAFSSWGQTAKTAKAEAQSFRQELEQEYDTTTLKGIESTYSDMYEELERLHDISKENQGIFSMIKGFGELISPINDNNIQKSHEAVVALADEMRDLEEGHANAKEVIDLFSESVGLTADEIEALAEMMNIDLREGTEYTINNFGDLVNSMPLTELEVLASNTGDVALELFVAAKKANSTTFAISDLGKQLTILRGPLKDVLRDTIELTDSQKLLQDAMTDIADFSSGIGDALDERKNIAQEAADAEIKALEAASEKRVESQEAYVDSLVSGTRSHKDAQAELKRMRDRESDELDAHRDKLRGVADDITLSLNEQAAALEKQNQTLENWQENLAIIASRTGDDDISRFLAAMGEDGVDLVGDMATATEGELERMVEAIKDNMELTGTESAIVLDAGLLIAETVGKERSGNIRKTIIDELALLPEDITQVMESFTEAIQQGLDLLAGDLEIPKILIEFDASPMPDPADDIRAKDSERAPPRGIGKTPPPSALDRIAEKTNSSDFSPRMPGMATGGIFPFIAKHPMLMFGERGTGGEAFIPLGNKNRSKSLQLWAETGRILGAPMHAAQTSYNNTTKSTRNSTSFEFTGDMHFSDPESMMRFAEKKRRTQALTRRG